MGFKEAEEHFYLRLFGVGHAVNDDSNGEKNHSAAVTSWTTLSDQQQRTFYMQHLTNRIAHKTAFVTPVVKHWLKRTKITRIVLEGLCIIERLCVNTKCNYLLRESPVGITESTRCTSAM